MQFSFTFKKIRAERVAHVYNTLLDMCVNLFTGKSTIGSFSIVYLLQSSNIQAQNNTKSMNEKSTMILSLFCFFACFLCCNLQFSAFQYIHVKNTCLIFCIGKIFLRSQFAYKNKRTEVKYCEYYLFSCD